MFQEGVIMICVQLARVRDVFSINNLAGDSCHLGRVRDSVTRSGSLASKQAGQQPTDWSRDHQPPRDSGVHVSGPQASGCSLTYDLEDRRQQIGGRKIHRIQQVTL